MVSARVGVFAVALALTVTGGAGGSGYIDSRNTSVGTSESAANSVTARPSESVQPTLEPAKAAQPILNTGAIRAAANTASAAAAQYTSEEFYKDYYDSVRVVDQYWGNHWAEFFPGNYVAPKLISLPGRAPGLYDGTVDVVSCGSTSLGPDNAAYCADGNDWVAYDVNFLWRARYNGDMFVYMIVAHEWGHAIQYRLNAASQSTAAELQADCFAGAALDGAVTDGTLKLEPGDLHEVQVGLTDIADSGPWGKPGDHGSPDERIRSFTIGWDQGPLGCVPR
jgi:predicted metalloprotease